MSDVPLTFRKLEDLDTMTFGKYKGHPMQDVPARYLHWLWTDGGLSKETKTSPVADYIKRNLDVLKGEYTNGIWD